MNFESRHDALDGARALDSQEEIKSHRDHFVFPQARGKEDPLYFAGHSLGLMPKKAVVYVNEELEDWGRFAVEGHFHSRHPWLPYHENLASDFAKIAGAKESEVVAMNTLTVNLHLMMVSFYRPTKSRYKILIEKNTFPSDKYAVDSQARFHGFDPKEAVVELRTQKGGITSSLAGIQEQMEELGDSLALVMLGNCNYLSGQCFPFEPIVKQAHALGAFAGFNLAHGAGNLHLRLHDWGCDFGVWCSYKYLNAGPGALAGAFVHERHLNDRKLPRFEGWWGHNKQSRFKMGPDFDPIPTAEAWQLSNPPILQLASLRASTEIFAQAGMENLRRRGDRLTAYFEWLLEKHLKNSIVIVTPPAPERGSMLCLRFKQNPEKWVSQLKSRDVHVDFRSPDIIRATPAPLYNTFEDVYRLVQVLQELSEGT
jgi:kynureninase